MTFRAVFFDAGETLVHPHPSFPELMAEVLRRENHAVEPGFLLERVHVVSDRFAKAARENELWTTAPERSRRFWLSVYEIFLGECGLPTDEGLAEKLYLEFTDLANYSLFEDVVPLLDRLRAEGFTLGVVSNFEEWLEHLLEVLGVTGYFDVRVISGIEGVEKPDLRIFELALERARVDASESVYVGDSPAFDVEPALSVGMFPVLIDRRGRFPDAAASRIRSLDELPAVLGL